MSKGGLTFNRRAVRPLECLREGWRLVKDDYWLFWGVTFVGSLLAGVAFGVLRGPALCGIHLTFLRREAGQRVSFDLLLKGFDYFVQGLIATLLMMVPALLIMLPCYLLFMGGMFASLGTLVARSPNEAPDLNTLWPIVALAVGFTVTMSALALVLEVFFLFAYPLIVDRGLSGVAAVKLSARAGVANFGGVLGLLLLMGLLGLVGLLACYVGLILLYPVLYAMIAVAYRQVFPPEGSVLFEPAPPPDWPEVGGKFESAEQTGVQPAADRPVSVAKSPEEPGIPPGVPPPGEG